LKEHNNCIKVRKSHDHKDANNTLVSDARFLGDHQGDRWRQGLEIAILRQQVRILQRKAKTTPRITDPEKMVLATLTDKFKGVKTGVHQRLNQVILIFKPETVLRLHRELVRRKWTYKRKGKPGRPGITAEVEVLIGRLAKENASWG